MVTDKGPLKLPTEDELLDLFQFMGREPVPRRELPEILTYHLVPEVVGFYLAGYEFLHTDTYSERFRDMMCVMRQPPVPDDESPVEFRYEDNRYIVMSFDIPAWRREIRRKIFKILNKKNLNRLKKYIGWFKEIILRRMCETEATERCRLKHQSRKSAKRSGASRRPDVPIDVGRPTSASWGFLKMTLPTSSESDAEDESSFSMLDEEALMDSLEYSVRSTPTSTMELKPDPYEAEITSERWRGLIRLTRPGESSRTSNQDLRPDFHSPVVTVLPRSGMLPSELLTREEKVWKIILETRNDDCYSTDNKQHYNYKKRIIKRFQEEVDKKATEKRSDKVAKAGTSKPGRHPPSTLPGHRPSIRPGASTLPHGSTRPASSTTTDPFEIYSLEQQALKADREKLVNERYLEVVEDHQKHIKLLEMFSQVLVWNWSDNPNVKDYSKIVNECLEEEKELLRSFKKKQPNVVQ